MVRLSHVYFGVVALLALASGARAASDFVSFPPIVQGDVNIVAVDATGARYVAGFFDTSSDFNPARDVKDEVAPVPGGFIAPTGGAFVTKFNADGSYAYTKAPGPERISGLAVSGTTLYVSGAFQNVAQLYALDTLTGNAIAAFGGDGKVEFVPTMGSLASLETPSAVNTVLVAGNVVYNCGALIGTATLEGTASPLTATGNDGFVFAVNALTGAPLATFGGGAVLAPLDGATSMAISGNSLFVCANRPGVAALNATTGAPLAAFGGTGVVTITGTANINTVSASATTLYASGIFSGTPTLGAVTFPVVPNTSGFCLALDVTTGALVPSFSDDGLVVLADTSGSPGFSLKDSTLSATTLFLLAQTPGTALATAQGATITVGATPGNSVLLALDPATGALKTSFGGDGAFPFPSNFDGTSDSVALSPDGATVFVAGATSQTALLPRDVALGGTKGYVFGLPADTGKGPDLMVMTTSDQDVGSLNFCMLLARNGSTIRFNESVFNLENSSAATVINVNADGLPPLFDGNITIDASDRRVTINGANTQGVGISIRSDGNKIMGLNIIAFPGSGIAIGNGGKNNVIGGNRLMGTGTNGQGLRISSCGAFGIDISGATNNVVKGCWIGLSAPGTTSEPNLAGIILQNGAKENIIGGTVDGEQNVMSGNSFEAVTVTGVTSDNNVIVNNFVGTAGVTVASTSTNAVSRAADDETIAGRGSLGNGAAGIFLSKGTTGSTVGGEDAALANTIGFNGGSGVEVRAANSRRNSAKRNRISKNTGGGISLFDGSNDGIAKPTFVSVKRKTTTTGASSRATETAEVTVSTSGEGTVEVYSDDGSQGETLVGRGTTSSSTFTTEVTVESDQNLTATYTDANGNTSSFSVFELNGDTTDTDGDGASDSLEEFAGTDSNSASSTPVDSGALTVDSTTVSLNFAKSNSDSLKAVLRFVTPAGYVNVGSSIKVGVDALTVSGSLDEKGSTPKGSATVKLSGVPKNAESIGTVVKATVSFTKSALQSGLTTSTLTNRTTSKTGETLTLPYALALTFNGTVYTYDGSVSVTYKATQGKSGKASKVK